MEESLVKDFRVWHTYEGAIYNYPAHQMTVDGLIYRVDPDATLYWPAAVQCGDYRNIDITIRGGSIHAGSVFGGCTDPLGIFRMEGVDAVTWGHAFSFETPATPGTGADRPASGVTMILRNNVVRPWPGRPLQTIEMYHTMSRGNSQPDDRYEIFVYGYQRQADTNFRVYFHEQATQNLYGGPAPCSDATTRPEIDGITCPMDTPGPAPFTDDPLVPRVTAAKAIHITELRSRVNGAREACGLTPFPFTDGAIAGVVIRRLDIVELRHALDAAYTACGMTPPSYTDPVLTDTPIKAIHIEQLRDAVVVLEVE
jgi:hypothetical protein